ncbi:hypothetical protein Tco_1214671 [Tanacetum coccineum]
MEKHHQLRGMEKGGKEGCGLEGKELLQLHGKSKKEVKTIHFSRPSRKKSGEEEGDEKREPSTTLTPQQGEL